MRKITQLLLLCVAMLTAGKLYAADTVTLWKGSHEFPSGWDAVFFANDNKDSFAEGGTLTAKFSTNGGNFGIGVSSDGSTLNNEDKIGFPGYDGYDSEWGYTNFDGNELSMTLSSAVAEKLNGAAYLVLNGEGCTITSLTYTAPAPAPGQVTLLSGSNELSWSGSNFYKTNDFKFELGDKLIFGLTTGDDAQIQLCYGANKVADGLPGYGPLANPSDHSNGNYTGVSGNYTVTIDADNIAAYNSAYLMFKGQNCTLNSITLERAGLSGSEDFKLEPVAASEVPDAPEGASNILYDRLTRFGVGEGQVYLARNYAFKAGDKITVNFSAINEGTPTDENPASKLCLAVTTLGDLNAGGSAIVNTLDMVYPEGSADGVINSRSVTFTLPDSFTGELNGADDKDPARKVLVLVGQNCTVSSIIYENGEVEPEQRLSRILPTFIQNFTLYGNEEGWPSYCWGFKSSSASENYTQWYNSQDPAPDHAQIQTKLEEERENWPWATDVNPDRYYLSLPPFASSIGDKIYIEFENDRTSADYDNASGDYTDNKMEVQFWTPRQNEDGSWDDVIYVFSDGNNYTTLAGTGYEIVINKQWQDAFAANGFRIKGRQFRITKVEWRHNTELDPAEDGPAIYHVDKSNFSADNQRFRDLCYGKVPFFYVFFQDGRAATETATGASGRFSYYGQYISEGIVSPEYVAQWVYSDRAVNLTAFSDITMAPDISWSGAVKNQYATESGDVETAAYRAPRAATTATIESDEKLPLWNKDAQTYQGYGVKVDVPLGSENVSGTLHAQRVVTALTDANGNLYPKNADSPGAGNSTDAELENYQFDPNMQLLFGLAYDGIYMETEGNRNGKIGAYLPALSDIRVSYTGGVITGVEDVTVSDDPDKLILEAYTLDGIRVSEMIPGRIYIVRCGNTVRKILAK